MGLPRAVQAHKEKNLKLAELHYIRALEQDVKDPVLYQNYGALLREQGNLVKAKDIYQRGLKLFPDHQGILLNAINFFTDQEDHTLVYFESNKLAKILLKTSTVDESVLKKLDSSLTCCISSLTQLGCLNSALAFVHLSLRYVGVTPKIAFQIYSLLSEINKSDFFEDLASVSDDITSFLQSSVDEHFDLEHQIQFYFAVAVRKVLANQITDSLRDYDHAIELSARLSDSTNLTHQESRRIQKLIDENSWNMSCHLLNLQQYQRGWKLFEYGLRTSAPGPQRWQRAVLKPFTDAEVPLWRGEDLSNKGLLLLEEQAVGDMMMFLSLLPRLVGKVKNIGILTNNRLVPIYRRTFTQNIFEGMNISVWSYNDVKVNKLSSDLYDYQVPVASICQYLQFSDKDLTFQNCLKLVPDQRTAELLRARYLQINNSPTPKKLIGVSWRGGGKGKRITQKSFTKEQFLRFLPKVPNVRYVSLQYGEEKSDVEYWRSNGVDIIYDESINPMQDMDTWLCQVAACDAVLSVPNTTVHGSGGLHIPTMCLLSRHLDWRWLKSPDVLRSYWYPSVGIAREQVDKNDCWSNASQLVTEWINNGCPQPTGPVLSIDN